MTVILISGVVGLVGIPLGTPLLIRHLHAKEYGQFTRQDGSQGHLTKHGTPTMGDLVIIVSTVPGYTLANLSQLHTPCTFGILLSFLVAGLGLIGSLDDFEKISKQHSLELRAWQKIVEQAPIGIGLLVAALYFTDHNGLTPASARISFARDSAINLVFTGSVVGFTLFILWANFPITAWFNAVSLIDGLDGLVTGASVVVFGAYMPIGVWQTNQPCKYGHETMVPTTCYQVRDPRDLAMTVATLMGACFGFLWWNAPSAKIFTGDIGSLALGGAVTGLSTLTRTEFLAIILGGLFLAEVMSDIIQIVSFKPTD